MKALILIVLIGACCAQTPTRPNIPETFESQVEVIVHESESYEGSGIIAQDQEKQESVQDIEIYVNGMNSTDLLLIRSDLDKEFLVTGRGSSLHCEVTKITNNSTLPEFWDWVKVAKYTGTVVINGKTLDQWQFTTASLRLQLMVDPNNVNVPQYLNYQLTGRRNEMKFVKFNATTPDSKYFAVPLICEF